MRGIINAAKRSPAQARFARQLFDLLQRPSRGRPQRGDAYDGYIRISSRDFTDHLFAGITLAVQCVAENGANFLAFDCDERIIERLPVYKDVLERRGLAKAAFVTTGSTPGRGKIVVTLANRIPQGFAADLARAIHEEVSADPRFGEVRRKTLTTFPSEGDGSFCRVLGRKYRNHDFERFGTLDGHERFDFSWIVPAKVAVPEVPVSVRNSQRSLSVWARELITRPFTGTYHDLIRAQLRLAREAVNTFGSEAEDHFGLFMEAIAKNSPTVSESINRQLLRPDAFPKAARVIAKSPTIRSWQPLPDTISSGGYVKVSPDTEEATELKVSPKAWRIYHSLATYVQARGLDPYCLGMDYARLADLAGYTDKSQAYRAAKLAEKERILVRLHKGSPRLPGRPTSGVPALFCLRGERDTLADAEAAGKRSDAYKARVKSTDAEGA